MVFPSKLCLDRVIMLYRIWPLPGAKLHYPNWCPTIVLKISIMQMNWVYFFKNIQTLPWRYRSQEKSWVDGVLFEEWVREINAELKTKVRKIALIIDNCPVHPEIENISLPKLIFLPPYTTLVIQSMDQGIIKSLKVHYRKRVVRVILTHLDQGNPIPKISLLKAMQLLAST